MVRAASVQYRTCVLARQAGSGRCDTKGVGQTRRGGSSPKVPSPPRLQHLTHRPRYHRLSVEMNPVAVELEPVEPTKSEHQFSPGEKSGTPTALSHCTTTLSTGLHLHRRPHPTSSPQPDFRGSQLVLSVIPHIGPTRVILCLWPSATKVLLRKTLRHEHDRSNPVFVVLHPI